MTNKYERERLARKFNKSKHLNGKHDYVKKTQKELPGAPVDRDLLGNVALTYEGVENNFRCPFDKELCDSNDLLYGEDDEPFDGKMTCSVFEEESFFRCERLPDVEFSSFLKRNGITLDDT